MYIQDMEKRLEKYGDYWKKENHDRPLISVTAPKTGVIRRQVPFSGSVRERWWDQEWVAADARAAMEATYFGGESLPILNPNLGPDVFAAFLGGELEYGKDTSWAHPIVEDWSKHHFAFDENNIYWKKILEMTEYFLKDSQGDYLVGVTDLHPGMDALVALRGPEQVCMDVYDYPEEIKRVLAEITEVFRKTLHLSYELIARYQKGTTNWMGIYHPENWYVSSSDFIYMISPETFCEFSKESIRGDAKIIGNNIYHLDGIGSARHLDQLLEMPEIHGIQWVYGDGQPTAAHWIDLLKRVQSAGKLVEISCVPADMKALFESGLKPEGLRYSVWAGSEEEADYIVKMAQAHTAG